MITPGVLDVAYWGTWRRGTVDLRTPGITFVRGINEDANGVANGAGKSSLFHAGSAMLLGDHQLATKKKSLKSIARDHTRIRMTLDHDGHAIVADMRGTDFRATVDGRAINSRVKGEDRNSILRRLGFSPELWYSTVHVNGIASNPLVRGTSRARCEFLERAFDLDRWAGAYGAVGDALVAMRRAQVDLDAARAELAALPPVVDVRRMRARSAAIAARARTLRDDISELTERMITARSLPPRPPGSPDQYARRIERLESELARSVDHAEREAAWRDATNRERDLRERMRAIPQYDGEPPDVDALVGRLNDLQERVGVLEAAVRVEPIVRRWRRIAERIADRHGMRWRGLDELRALSRSWVANLRAGATSCPVCGGALRSRVDAREVEELAEALRDLPDRLIVEVPKDGDRLHGALSRAQQDLRDARSRADHEAMRRELSAEMRQLRVPPRPPSPSDVDGLRRDLSRARDLHHAAKKWADLREHPGQVHDIRARLDAAVARLRALEDDEREITATLAEGEANAAARERTTERIGSLEAEVDLLPSYRALHAAYSPMGMRLWLLGELLEALMDGLNETQHGTRDRVEFGYRLGRNRDLAITASNLQATFDVRLLSGAEGNMFCLNLLSVLLPRLPAHRRCSTLIIDELDANCDPRVKQIIAREHLPRLAEVCPTMFVITPEPRAVFDVPEARQLVVVKKDGESRVRSHS